MAHQFKAGDRVRVNGDPHNQAYAREYGYKGTLIVDHIEGEDLVCFDKDGHCGMFSFRLEPAPALIDPAKKYRTRDGREVRILAVDAKGIFPVVAVVTSKSGSADNVVRMTEDGKAFVGRDNSNDLIEVKPERDLWLVWRRTDSHDYFMSYEHKPALSECPNAVAMKRVTITEGEGLA